MTIDSIAPTPSTTPGRPKDLAKRAAILQAAQTLFLKLGYDGSSMDAIAAEAGVSKLTVYSHFNDKESLFSAAVEAHCAHQLPPLCFDLAPETPIAQALFSVARRFQGMLGGCDAIAMHRLMVGMAVQNPALTLLFFNAGPKRAITEMSRLLQQAHDQHKLEIPDVAMAADFFLSSFSGCSHFRHILAIDSQCDEVANEAYAHEVVQRFMRGYGVGAI
jgi:TetR/AcrR family transcriptional repressor of mexJK operon